MAQLQVNFFSEALMKITTFQIVLPNDVPPMMMEENIHFKRPIKTLYLLHGFSGNSMDWLLGSRVQELAVKYNLAIVMPSGDNSFYLDTKGVGKAYCRYIGKELVEYVAKTFGLSDKKEENFIGGYSMGGYGAIHTGLIYPNTFGKIIAFSSALIIHDIINIEEGYTDMIADYDYYIATFGELRNLEGSNKNPEYLIKERKMEKQAIPSIYMACGTEDLLIENNRAFHKFLVKEAIDVQYSESTGMHDWTFWNQYLEPSILWSINPVV